jgi:ATP-binding cassette subfamily B protein
VSRLYQDKTVIAIAHRLSTIRSADTILVLAAGQIVEAGSHDALMRRDGAYATLVGRLEAGESTAEAVEALAHAAGGDPPPAARERRAKGSA